MAYVPPALRKKQYGDASDAELNTVRANAPTYRREPHGRLPSLDDIQNYYWPTAVLSQETLPQRDRRSPVEEAEVGDDQSHAVGSGNDSVRQQEVTIEDDHDGIQQKPLTRQHSTLNARETDPTRLQYVLLFQDANPRWKTDSIIYAKSELQLLPKQVEGIASKEDGSTSLKEGHVQTTEDVRLSSQVPQKTTPLAKDIAVFDQDARSSHPKHGATFEFIGYHNLVKMDILEPESPELARMLEQKWTRSNKWGKTRQIQRDAASWKKSLGHTWAVLKFEKNEKASSELAAPDIAIAERQPPRNENDPGESRKGVSEMLKELRMKDEKVTN